MAEHMKVIDISETPELLWLAEEVKRTHEAHVLRREGEDLAVVSPLGASTSTRRRGHSKKALDLEAFRRAAGSWKDLVDADKLIEDIYESRRISTRPPVDL